MTDFEHQLAEVGKGHHANGFMACVVRIGQIGEMTAWTVSAETLFRLLLEEARAQPGYTIKVDEPKDLKR